METKVIIEKGLGDTSLEIKDSNPQNEIKIMHNKIYEPIFFNTLEESYYPIGHSISTYNTSNTNSLSNSLSSYSTPNPNLSNTFSHSIGPNGEAITQDLWGNELTQSPKIIGPIDYYLPYLPMGIDISHYPNQNNYYTQNQHQLPFNPLWTFPAYNDQSINPSFYNSISMINQNHNEFDMINRRFDGYDSQPFTTQLLQTDKVDKKQLTLGQVEKEIEEEGLKTTSLQYITVDNMSKPRRKRAVKGSGPAHTYQCTYPGCGKTFTRPYNVKAHMRIHTQERPFRCSVCSYAFSRLHDMKRHLNLHTGNKPYQCPSCKKGFARLDAMNRHYKKDLNTCAAIKRSKKNESSFST